MGKGAASENTQTTSTVDKRITVQNGNVQAITDSTIQVSKGGVLTITNNDQQTAQAAIAALNSSAAGLFSVVTDLSRGANAEAGKVVDSQANFVGTASGQKYVTYIVAIAGGAVALLVLPMVIKSFRK